MLKFVAERRTKIEKDKKMPDSRNETALTREQIKNLSVDELANRCTLRLDTFTRRRPPRAGSRTTRRSSATGAGAIRRVTAKQQPEAKIVQQKNNQVLGK